MCVRVCVRACVRVPLINELVPTPPTRQLPWALPLHSQSEQVSTKVSASCSERAFPPRDPHLWVALCLPEVVGFLRLTYAQECFAAEMNCNFFTSRTITHCIYETHNVRFPCLWRFTIYCYQSICNKKNATHR